MQQWEYLFVIVDRDSGRWRPRYENDQELPDWYKGPTVSQYANQRGEQGWELISLTASTDRNGYIGDYQYVFKHPKP